MKTIKFLAILFAVLSAACAEQKDTTGTGPMDTDTKKPTQPTEKVVKSDEEWKKILTPEQYRVARKAGTEMRDNATYKQYKAQGPGTYYCVGCGTELFHSATKIDANCGWPAFYDASDHKNVATKIDMSHGVKRVEVVCAKCDAHLGHVFEGEGFNTPTDKRYCINGIILKFVPDTAKAEEKEKKP